jgi:hypothetical protein
MQSNRFASRLALGFVVAGTLFSATAAQAGGPNVPYCFALANQYNACMAQAQRSHGGGGWGGGGGYGYDRGDGRGWGGHRGYGEYGGGYGGGYGGYDDGRYYRQQRRAARAQSTCAPWLMQMKANRCI